MASQVILWGALASCAQPIDQLEHAAKPVAVQADVLSGTTKSGELSPILSLTKPLAGETGPARSATNPADHAYIFYDASIPGLGRALSGKPGFTVVPLHSGDPFTQIAQALKGKSNIREIHIITHGEQGAVKVDGSLFTTSGGDSASLAQIGQALSPGADILLYGCDIGKGAEGQAFIDELAQKTGADVAAAPETVSIDPKRKAPQLTMRTGPIESGTIGMGSWRGQLWTSETGEGAWYGDSNVPSGQPQSNPKAASISTPSLPGGVRLSTMGDVQVGGAGTSFTILLSGGATVDRLVHSTAQPTTYAGAVTAGNYFKANLVAGGTTGIAISRMTYNQVSANTAGAQMQMALYDTVTGTLTAISNPITVSGTGTGLSTTMPTLVGMIPGRTYELRWYAFNCGAARTCYIDNPAIYSQLDQAPTATNDAISTAYQTAVSGNIVTTNNGSGLDSDPEGQSLTVDRINGAAFTVGSNIALTNGTLVINSANGAFTFTPNAGFTGTQTFTYRVNDGFGLTSANATVTITVGSPRADLSLTKTVSTTSPQYGAQVSYTLTVTSAVSSNATATGITVSDALPAGYVFRSYSGTGTYNSGSGVWTVGSLAPGASASITIDGANNTAAVGTVTNTAQITASSLLDPDSTVNNGVTTEDDYASVAYTTAAYPPAGTPPTFTCSAGSNLFDWDTQAWTNGATSGSWTVGGVPIALAFSGSTNRFVTEPSTGVQTPFRSTTVTNSSNGNTLVLVNDFASASTESVTGTWTFTNGVAGLRFTIADVDHYFGQYSDKITVTGSYLGTAVTPTLTAGSTTTVSGNVASAVALSANTDAAGNVIVTFDKPVDTVTISYAPDPVTGPADPGIQGIGLMDMTFCNRTTDLSLAKAVNNTTPTSGSTVNYTLTVLNNTATAMSASGITVRDVLPAGFTFVSASGAGTFNSGTGVWTVGNVAAGATASITLTGTVSGSTGTVVTNTAQITASSLPDPDSTVNNGVTSEDDYASAAFTISTISISVTKISAVLSDPINGTSFPKAIPGATMEYCILVTNTGSTAISNVSATDALPANFTYSAGSMTSGNTCATATTVEDDNNTDADETDPFGALISGTTITANAASLNASGSFALKFRGIVN